MGFAKSSVLGFTVGFVAAIGVSLIKIDRPAFLINAKTRERLSKKEAAALLNDAYEDRDILFSLILIEEGDGFEHLDAIRIKALTEPRWAKVLEKIEESVKRERGLE